MKNVNNYLEFFSYLYKSKFSEPIQSVVNGVTLMLALAEVNFCSFFLVLLFY